MIYSRVSPFTDDHNLLAADSGMGSAGLPTAMSVPPARILVVDDLSLNLPGAHSVGMQGAHFRPGSSLSSFVCEHLAQEESCSFG